MSGDILIVDKQRKPVITQHARERLADRFGITSESDVGNIIASPWNGMGVFVTKVDGGRDIWQTRCKGQDIQLVVDIARRVVFTAIPPTFVSDGSAEASQIRLDKLLELGERVEELEQKASSLEKTVEHLAWAVVPWWKRVLISMNKSHGRAS
jgi:hypothetical protein